MTNLEIVRQKIQDGAPLTNSEGAWLLARAQNQLWALHKILRQEPITTQDMQVVVDEFDYMPIKP